MNSIYRIMGAVLAAAVFACCPCTLAAERIALVVGNSEYTRLSPLANPANDADLIAEALEDVGFDVTKLLNADRSTMVAAVQSFASAIESAGPEAVGLFFYAGHGAQSQGANYLIPLGAEVAGEDDLPLSAVSAAGVLDAMGQAGGALNVVILDACRNRPFPRSRSAGGGLAYMRGPSGSLIAYSTAPGAVAVDGTGRHSPYATALAKAIRVPGVRIVDVFREVRVAVEKETKGRQTPWESSSLTGDFFYFNPPPTDASGQGRVAEQRPSRPRPGRPRPPAAGEAAGGWMVGEGRAALTAGIATARKQALLAASLQAIDASADRQANADVGVTRTFRVERIADAVAGRAQGFIKQYAILKEGPTADGQSYAVRIQALVEEIKPEQGLDAIRQFVTLIGVPKVLFILSERADNDTAASGADDLNLELEQGDLKVSLSRKAAQSDADAGDFHRISSAEQFMAQRFREAGYEVATADDVYGTGFVDDDELRKARRGIGSFAARIGRAADADLVIVGNVRYEVNEIDTASSDLAGQLGFVALTAKALVPGSGRVLTVASHRQRYLAVQTPSALAAREEALARAANAAADELKWQASSLLMRETRNVSLEIKNVTFSDAERAKRFLAALPGIDSVRMDGWRDDVSRYLVASRYAGPTEYDLAGALEEEFDAFDVVEIGHYKVVGSF